MEDFCNGYKAETADERELYWAMYNVLTPLERMEYDRLVLGTAVGQDHAVRFAELAHVAEERLG